jgi:rhodanese-related sulfurtransferase
MVLVALPVWTFAAEPYAMIGPSELKALVNRQEMPLQIIDSRSEGEFQEAHIRQAINVTLAVMETNPESLPYKKTDKVVFYCNGFS